MAVHVGEAHVDDFKLVAAPLFKADGRAHQGVDLLHLGIGARFIGRLAVGIGAAHAVHQHGHAEAVDHAGLAHLIAHGTRDFIVHGFFGAGFVGRGPGPLHILELALGQVLAHGHRGRFLILAVHLLFDRHGGARHLRVGVVQFLVGHHAVEVHVGVDLGTDLARPQRARQQGLDRARHALFLAAAGFLAGQGSQTAVLVHAAGQHLTALIDDGHLLGRQMGHCGGDQVLNRHHLTGLQGAALRGHHDRGRRRIGLTREHLAAGQHQMNARGAHAVDAANGAGQFAFQSAQQVDVLHEVGGAQGAGVVEHLVADRGAAADRQFRRLQPQAVALVPRHADFGAVLGQLIGNVLVFQALHDGLRLSLL